jgi:hypothetical protein
VCASGSMLGNTLGTCWEPIGNLWEHIVKNRHVPKNWTTFPPFPQRQNDGFIGWTSTYIGTCTRWNYLNTSRWMKIWA